MHGLMADVFVLVKLTKLKNGRGGWTLQKNPNGEIFGCTLPVTIQEVYENRQAESNQYDLKIMIWQSDLSLIDTETLIQFADKTYKVQWIDDKNRLSDKAIIYLKGEDGDGTAIYT